MSRNLPTSQTEAFSFRLEELVALLAPSARPELPILLLHDSYLPNETSTHYKHVDFHAIFLIERGRGTHMIDAVPYAISRGDVYVLGPGCEGYFLDCERLVVHLIMFRPELFERSTWNGLAALPGFESLLIGDAASRRLHLPPTAYAEAARDLAQLWSEWQSGTDSGAIMVPALLVGLLVRLSRFAAGDAPPALHPPARKSDHGMLVASAVRTIDLRYRETLRVSELASAAHVSPGHFTEIFSAVMGQTPRDYIRHVRLEHAKTLLRGTTLPVSEIARATGYRTHANFTRAFHTETGVSPREFRLHAHD